jgi:hypothetical protein
MHVSSEKRVFINYLLSAKIIIFKTINNIMKLQFPICYFSCTDV